MANIGTLLSRLIAVPFLGVVGAVAEAADTLKDHGIVRKRFRIGDRVVCRPEAFDGKDARIVFAIVAERLEQLAWQGAVLESFTDHDIARIARYRRYPLETWHAVLAHFVAEGILFYAWRLILPKEQSRTQVPTWDTNGFPLPDRGRTLPHDRRLDDPTFFWPDRLSDEDRARALGQSYACEPNTGPGEAPPPRVTLKGEHFERVHAIPSGTGEYPHTDRGPRF